MSMTNRCAPSLEGRRLTSSASVHGAHARDVVAAVPVGSVAASKGAHDSGGSNGRSMRSLAPGSSLPFSLDDSAIDRRHLPERGEM